MAQRLGTLGELFGVVRQVAGDGSSVLYNSLISAQYPKRDEFFADLGKAKALPSIAQLERLWFEIQREMTESGRVVRFETRIVDADGAPTAGGGGPNRRLRRRLGVGVTSSICRASAAWGSSPASLPATWFVGPCGSRRPGAATSQPRSIRRAACCSR